MNEKIYMVSVLLYQFFLYILSSSKFIKCLKRNGRENVKGNAGHKMSREVFFLEWNTHREQEDLFCVCFFGWKYDEERDPPLTP